MIFLQKNAHQQLATAETPETSFQALLKNVANSFWGSSWSPTLPEKCTIHYNLCRAHMKHTGMIWAAYMWLTNRNNHEWPMPSWRLRHLSETNCGQVRNLPQTSPNRGERKLISKFPVRPFPTFPDAGVPRKSSETQNYIRHLIYLSHKNKFLVKLNYFPWVKLTNLWNNHIHTFKTA